MLLSGRNISFACLTVSLDFQVMFVIFAYSSLFSIITSWFFLLTLPEFFQMRIPAQQMVMTTTLITVLHVWYCHHPGSKLWMWDSFLSPGKASSLPRCAVLPFPPRLLSWLLLAEWWCGWSYWSLQTQVVTCHVQQIWVNSWRDLVFGYWDVFPGDDCVSVRGHGEKMQESFGPVLLRETKEYTEKQFVIIFCFCCKTFWSVFSKDSVQLKWHILSVRVCVSLSTWLSKTVFNCSLFFLW